MKKQRVYKILYGVMTAMLSLQSDGEKPNGGQEEERRQPVGTAGGEFVAPVVPVAPVVANHPVSDHAAPEVAEEPAAQEAIEEPEETVTPDESEGSHEESPTDFVEEDFQASPQNDEETQQPAEETVEEPAEETVTPDESEESREESPTDFVEEDFSASPQNDEETQQPAEETVEEPAEETVPPDESEGSHEENPTDFVEEDFSASPRNDEETQQPAEETVEEPAEDTQEEEPQEEIDTRFPTVDGLCFEWREQTQTYAVTGVDEEQQRATQVVIPRELFGYPVTEIGDSAFRGCRFLTEVVVPEGVTKIDNRAFYGCYALERVELPDSLTSVGDEVFYLCMAITSQTQYDNAYYLGNRRNPYVLLSIHQSGDITSCAIHPRTKFIDRGAFAECRSLAKIEIPGSVIGIGCKAFYRCVSLESVTLGSSLARIGESAFYGCSFLRTVEFTGTREAWESLAIGKNNDPLTTAVRFRPPFSRPQ